MGSAQNQGLSNPHPTPHPLSLTLWVVVDDALERTEPRIRSPSPQGDRKGPHPAPHHPRPYNENERIVTRRVS